MGVRGLEVRGRGTGSGLHNCISRVYAPANIGSRLVNGNQNEQVKDLA